MRYKEPILGPGTQKVFLRYSGGCDGSSDFGIIKLSYKGLKGMVFM